MPRPNSQSGRTSDDDPGGSYSAPASGSTRRRSPFGRSGKHAAAHRPEAQEDDRPSYFASTSCCSCFTQPAAKYPASVAASGLLFVAVVVLTGMLAAPPKIETKFVEESQGNLGHLRENMAFNAALQMRLAGLDLYKNFDIYIAYELKSRKPFSVNQIIEVAEFERRMRALPEWKTFCSKAATEFQQLCEIGLSFANYALPTHQPPGGSVVPTAVSLDGGGNELLPYRSVFELLRRYNLTNVLLPKALADDSLTSFRSVFRFRRHCCNSNDTDSTQSSVADDMRTEWEDFLKDSLIPILRQPQPAGTSSSEWPLQVWFTIESSDDELAVIPDVMRDIKLAVGGSSFVVFLYLLLSTRNVVMSFAGSCLLALSPLFTYCILGAIARSRKLNVASLGLLFPSLGFGADALLLYSFAWQEAVEQGGSHYDQLLFTWGRASFTSFSAAFITAFAFLGTLPAGSPHLRLLAAYMSLHILFQWVFIATVYVPLLAVDDRLRKSRLSPFGLCRFDPCGSLAIRRAIAHAWTEFAHRRRRLCFSVISLISLGFAIAGIAFARVEDSTPDSFPAEHNQNRGRQLMAEFVAPSTVLSDAFQPPPAKETVCNERIFSDAPGDASSCSVLWCESEAKAAPADDCDCYKQDLQSDCSSVPASNITVEQRFVGLSLSQLRLNGTIPAGGSAWHMPLPADVAFVDRPRLQRLAPLLLQEWETGATHLEPVTDATAIVQGQKRLCRWRDLCYCGSARCSLPRNSGWSIQAPLRPPPVAIAASGQGRWSADKQGAVSGTTSSIYAVVGLEANYDEDKENLEWGSLWNFFGPFDPAELWSQRSQYSLCSGLPKDLGVVSKVCWIEDFKAWIVSGKGRYPVPAKSFHRLISEFLAESPSSAEYLWIRDGEVKAWYAKFEVNVRLNTSATELAAYRGKWDAYFHKWREAAPKSVKGEDEDNADEEERPTGAWHTSPLWARVEVETPSSSGVVVSLVLATVLVLLGLAAATCSWPLALSAALASVASFFGLLFAAAVVLDQALGFTEIVSFIVALGYAATYSIHVCHVYSGSGAFVPDADCGDGASLSQHGRARTTAGAVGATIVGSAVVAAGCSIFLAVGFLPIFKDVGYLALIGVPLAAIIALAFVPASLELFDPLDESSRHPERRQPPDGVSASSDSRLGPHGEPLASEAPRASPRSQGLQPQPEQLPSPSQKVPKIEAAPTQASGAQSSLPTQIPAGGWQASLI